jgi:micrococcal nuclease
MFGWSSAAPARLALFLAFMVAFWGCQAQSQVPVTEALVARVVDGDTVILVNGHRVRLLGIDAPELEHEGQPADFLAHKAKRVLTDLAQGRRVHLKYDQLRYDRYGRTLAFLILPDGTNLSRELVRQGLAHVYTVPPNMLFRDELLTAQREAMESRRGIWLKALNQDESFYIGNKRSFIFHRPTCPQGKTTAKSNRRHFTAITDAYQQGFSPCRTCRP